MHSTQIDQEQRALRGAIQRAAQLPIADKADPGSTWGDWDHDGTWLGDWGKSESAWLPPQSPPPKPSHADKR